MSGEKKAEQDPEEPYSGKYFVSLVSILSVHSLSVAKTTCRSWIRKDHIHLLLDFITPKGGGGIDSNKAVAVDRPIGTGEPSDALMFAHQMIERARRERSEEY